MQFRIPRMKSIHHRHSYLQYNCATIKRLSRSQTLGLFVSWRFRYHIIPPARWHIPPNDAWSVKHTILWLNITQQKCEKTFMINLTITIAFRVIWSNHNNIHSWGYISTIFTSVSILNSMLTLQKVCIESSTTPKPITNDIYIRQLSSNIIHIYMNELKTKENEREGEPQRQALATRTCR